MKRGRSHTNISLSLDYVYDFFNVRDYRMLIFDQLPVIDIMSFVRAFPLLRAKINVYDIAISRFNDIVPPFGISQMTLKCNAMHSKRYAFTGSRVIDMLTKLNPAPILTDTRADVDIICCGDACYKYGGFLQRTFDVLHIYPNDAIDMSSTKPYMKRGKLLVSTKKVASRYFVGGAHEHDVDFLLSNASNLSDHIRGHDFDVCRIYINARELRVLHPKALLKRQIRLDFSDYILDNFSEIDAFSGIDRIADRIISYKARGFTFYLTQRIATSAELNIQWIKMKSDVGSLSYQLLSATKAIKLFTKQWYLITFPCIVSTLNMIPAPDGKSWTL